jgi:hypothetical protein
LLYRWYAAFRSFRAHIRIQSATTGGRVDLGAAFQVRGEHHLPNARTDARAEGIERLLAIHPWADAVDLQMFLMGFDAGEEYGTYAQKQNSRNPELLNTPTKTK